MSNIKIKFSGHQTFTFRYGWLEKGYEYIKSDQKFSDPYAFVVLGVGKNMVSSIQYWAGLADIVYDNKVTEFGEKLLNRKTGWDPFLEDNASLWLLHYKIATNQRYFTSATVIFSYLNKPEFFKWNVLETALRQFPQLGVKKAPAEKMMFRDIDCFIKAYATGHRLEQGKNNDASFACPLQELQLISAMNSDEGFSFSIGPKPSLPYPIVGYAISDFLHRQGKVSSTVQNMLYGVGAPGLVFMLDENSLLEAVLSLQEDPNWGEYFELIESAGNAQIYCRLDKNQTFDLLENYYRPVI